MVEFVIVVPLAFLVVLLMVQAILFFHARDAAQAAAREGAQVARLYQGSDSDGITQTQLFLRTVVPTLVHDPQVSLTRTPSTVTVHIRGQALSAFPWPLSGWRINETSSAPVERFTAARAPT